MFKRRTNRWDELAVLVDTGAAYLAYLVVIHIYMTWINPDVATVQLATFYYSFSAVMLGLSWLVLKLNFRGYSRRWNQLPAEMGILLLSNVEINLGLAMIIFIVKATWFSRIIFVVLPLGSLVLQTIVHGFIKISLGKFRLSGRDLRHVVVIGFPRRVEIFSETVVAVPESGLAVRASYEVPLGDAEAGRNAVNNLYRLVHDTVVDTVVLALPMADDVMMEAVQLARREGKEVRMVLDEVGALAHRSRLYDFYGNSVLVVDSSQAHQSSRRLVKRTIDIVGAIFGIIVSAPIMIAIMLAMKLSEPKAPVLFAQRRVGLNGREFFCLKFRTMIPEAETMKEQLSHLNMMSGPVFKIADDPRVTRVGKLLRRSSLDELPQLFNVFWGQMSLVGPRPALPSEVRQYGEDYRKRLSVRPGLTCLWQISGRNDVDFQEWMRLDMEYIESWSILLDFKIMAKTLPAVFQQRGAH